MAKKINIERILSKLESEGYKLEGRYTISNVQHKEDILFSASGVPEIVEILNNIVYHKRHLGNNYQSNLPEIRLIPTEEGSEINFYVYMKPLSR